MKIDAIIRTPRDYEELLSELRPGGVLLVGPPGARLVMMGRDIGLRVPPPTGKLLDECLAIYEAAFGPDKPGQGYSYVAALAARAPFRAPHHTVSAVGMTGSMQKSGKWLPGELSLAHGGTLLLDWVPEFGEYVLRIVAHVVGKWKGTVLPHGAKAPLPANPRMVIGTCLSDEKDSYYQRLGKTGIVNVFKTVVRVVLSEELRNYVSAAVERGTSRQN